MSQEPKQRPLVPVTSGHDAPVGDRAGDFYDRWPIATAISHVIGASPAEWSTRIGLFGRWGDGKTSVLNFLEKQQCSAGNIVIQYSPWGASTVDQVWKDFGAVLIKGLSKNGISIGKWPRFLHFVKHHAEKITEGMKTLGRAVQATGQVPGVAMGSDFASKLISDQLRLSRTDIKRLSNQLGQRRVVVFIDDLDRADPVVVPKLLLALRELLDFSRFAYVLAFDRMIVARAQETYNPAWSHAGGGFLDKVIDFPFDLPSPSENQIKRLAHAQFRANCSFVPSGAIDDIGKLLPGNPRKLKLFARMIASLKEEAARHEADELNWPVILVFTLIRAESESFANKLLAMTVDTDEFSWIKWAMPDKNAEKEKRDAMLVALIADYPELQGIEVRMKKLVEGWRERCSYQSGELLRYQATFALAPHCVTWGELKAFFAEWRKKKFIDTTQAFIGNRAKATQHEKNTVEAEFVNAVISYYSILLEKAAEVGDKAIHLALMSESSDTLDLLTQCLGAVPRALDLDSATVVSLWERLLSCCLQWRHFDANEREPELRAKEADTVALFATVINEPLTLYEFLKPWGNHEPLFDARSANLKSAFLDQIRSQLEPKAIEAALRFVIEAGQMKKLRSREEYLAARFLLTAPQSPLFKDPAKSTLLQVIDGRSGTLDGRQDALDYLDLLLSALEHGDNMYCGAGDRKEFISTHPDLMIRLWSLVVSSPSQFRFLTSLRERRAKLVEAGVAIESLAEPDWLKEPSKV